MTRKSNAPKPLCCVSIDHSTYLLPADKGMKVVELMQEAVRVDRDWDRESPHHHYVPRGDLLEVSFTSVKPSQVRMSTADPGVPEHSLSRQVRLLK